MSVLDRIRNGELQLWHSKYGKYYKGSEEDKAEVITTLELGERMRWISVSERLPEDGQCVDIWIKKCGVRETDYFYFANPGYFGNLTNKYATEISEVSHWRLVKNDRPDLMNIDYALRIYTDKVNAKENIDMGYFKNNLSTADFKEFQELIPYIGLIKSVKPPAENDRPEVKI